jgi:hypothetical protein
MLISHHSQPIQCATYNSKGSIITREVRDVRIDGAKDEGLALWGHRPPRGDLQNPLQDLCKSSAKRPGIKIVPTWLQQQEKWI